MVPFQFDSRLPIEAPIGRIGGQLVRQNKQAERHHREQASQLYNTLLLVASLKGRTRVFKLLLDNGAEISQRCGKEKPQHLILSKTRRHLPD